MEPAQLEVPTLEGLKVAQEGIEKTLPTLNFEVFGYHFSPTYVQAGLVVFLIFLLIWTLARLRYMFVNWSLGKSSIAMLIWGAILTLILEGFMLVGGRTILTEVLGWKNAPEPIKNALDVGRERLVEVLGVTSEVPQSSAEENQTYIDVITSFQSLSPDESEKARSLICAP